MENNNRKRNYQDRDDVELVVIESSEDDSDGSFTSENQDNNIEEDEEFTDSGRLVYSLFEVSCDVCALITTVFRFAANCSVWSPIQRIHIKFIVCLG